MLCKAIIVCVTINFAISYGFDGIANTDGTIRTPTQNAQISEAGKHIVAKINEARALAKKYDHLIVDNMNVTEATKHIDDILTIFMDVTYDFDSYACVELDEKDMGRTVENNCYALITNKITNTIKGKYELVVGEKAYMVTDSVTNEEIKYEFFLGPLYFGVYRSKP
ncbi:unnamed protein product [Oppiella nova]|uniref:Uncharacterized protein n=1 Tax=Oppiella nova TaxID=334625 RepID=A0A7R9M7N5_9ACAR|nr:unnamed protein product [Oppiella nova]CAG2172014.1 unnamed protein product [Oppiella nova]